MAAPLPGRCPFHALAAQTARSGLQCLHDSNRVARRPGPEGQGGAAKRNRQREAAGEPGQPGRPRRDGEREQTDLERRAAASPQTGAPLPACYLLAHDRVGRAWPGADENLR